MRAPFKAVEVDEAKLWAVLPLRDLEEVAKYESGEKRERLDALIMTKKARLRSDPRRAGVLAGARG